MFARNLRPAVVLLAVFMLAAIYESRAEEGMWTFDNPPLKQLEEKYNFHAHAGVAGSSSPLERAVQ